MVRLRISLSLITSVVILVSATECDNGFVKSNQEAAASETTDHHSRTTSQRIVEDIQNLEEGMPNTVSVIENSRSCLEDLEFKADCRFTKSEDGPSKGDLLEKLDDLLVLNGAALKTLDKMGNYTNDDFDDYFNSNKIVHGCYNMHRIIEDEEYTLLKNNFTHKACLDYLNLFRTGFSELNKSVSNYSDTYTELLQSERELIMKNSTHLGRIKDNVEKCTDESCLEEASKDLAIFRNLESDLASFLDEIDAKLTKLKTSSYISINNTAAVISPDGLKSYKCYQNLMDARSSILKNEKNSNRTINNAQDHLNEQIRDANDYIDVMYGPLDENLTGYMNSTVRRIEIHTEKAFHFNVNTTACPAAELEMNVTKNKFLTLFQDVTDDFKNHLLTNQNQTLDFIRKYQITRILSNLSLCVDEDCIEDLVSKFDNVKADVDKELFELDNQIKLLEDDITVRKQAVAEAFFMSINKTYDEITECIDDLWMTKLRLSQDISQTYQNFANFIAELGRIEQNVQDFIKFYQDNITEIHAQYKQNLSEVRKEETKMKDLTYWSCKKSVNAFKNDNYSETFDKMVSDYKDTYKTLMSELENDSKNITTRLDEIRINATRCRETDNFCLHNIFRQYEGYLLRNLSDILNKIAQKNMTLSHQFQIDSEYLVRRVSVEGDEAVSCMKKLTEVKGKLDGVKASLVTATLNVTDQVKNANFSIQNEKEQYEDELDAVSLTLMSGIRNHEAIAKEKKLNISACYSANLIKEYESEYVERFTKAIEPYQSDISHTALKCTEKIKLYESYTSDDYHGLLYYCYYYHESCFDLIANRTEIMKNEHIPDVEVMLSRKIHNVSSMIQSKREKCYNDFLRDVKGISEVILDCIDYVISTNSSSMLSLSIIIILVSVIVQLNLNLLFS